MDKFIEFYKKKVKTFTLITFLCFIFMLICSLASFYNSMQEQIKLKENSLKQYTNQFKESINEYIEYRFTTLEYLATYPQVYNMDWAEQYNFLNSQERPLKITHFIVMDLDGYGHYTNRNEIKDQSKEQFFIDVMNHDRFITDPFIETYENRAIITLSVPIYNNDIKVGALCGVFDLSRAFNIFKEKLVGNEGYAFVIDKDGNYIAHKNSDYIFNRNNFFEDLNGEKQDIETLRKNIANNNTNLEELILDDTEYYAIFSTFKSTDWELVFIVPKSEFLINLNRFTIFQALTIISATLLIILLINLINQNSKNHKLAYIDSLTNIGNRAAIDTMFKKFESKNASEITIICFDLNDFKQINDTYGHHIGDRLLREFSSILNNTFGKIGFVGRFGGDEFISILVNIDILKIESEIKEINKLICNYNNDNLYKLKMSYGYATREAFNNTSLINIYKEADKNMYEFKNKYKNTKK